MNDDVYMHVLVEDTLLFAMTLLSILKMIFFTFVSFSYFYCGVCVGF